MVSFNDRAIDSIAAAGRAAVTRRGLLGTSAKVAGGGTLALSGLGSARTGGGVFAQDATPVVGDLQGALAGLDPQMQQVLEKLQDLNKIPTVTQTPFNARQLPSPADAVAALLAERGEAAQEAVAGVEHQLITTPNGDLIGRVYTPDGQAPFPVLVYFHGGGFVIANLNTYDASCRALANAAGCVVVSVAYRQAPENPFPAAADDAYFSFQYVAENASLFGGDPDRVAVAGESAGGNLVAVVSLLARDQGGIEPIHQVLVYPITTYQPEGEGAETIQEYATAQPLNAALLDWFEGFYAPDPASPSASPLLAADLSGLPPATIIAAEIDPLQGQGRQYADALEAAGNDVTYTLYEGVTHEFFGTGAVVDQANDAVAETADRLRESFDVRGDGTPTA